MAARPATRGRLAAAAVLGVLLAIAQLRGQEPDLRSHTLEELARALDSATLPEERVAIAASLLDRGAEGEAVLAESLARGGEPEAVLRLVAERARSPRSFTSLVALDAASPTGRASPAFAAARSLSLRLRDDPGYAAQLPEALDELSDWQASLAVSLVVECGGAAARRVLWRALRSPDSPPGLAVVLGSVPDTALDEEALERLEATVLDAGHKLRDRRTGIRTLLRCLPRSRPHLERGLQALHANDDPASGELARVLELGWASARSASDPAPPLAESPPPGGTSALGPELLLGLACFCGLVALASTLLRLSLVLSLSSAVLGAALAAMAAAVVLSGDTSAVPGRLLALFGLTIGLLGLDFVLGARIRPWACNKAVAHARARRGGAVESKRSGLTLVEVAVAAALLFIGLLGVLATLSSALLVEASLSQHSRAAHAARGKIEELRGGDLATLRALHDGTRFAVPGLTVSPGESAGVVIVDDADPALVRVEVSVRWTGFRGAEVFTEAALFTED